MKKSIILLLSALFIISSCSSLDHSSETNTSTPLTTASTNILPSTTYKSSSQNDSSVSNSSKQVSEDLIKRDDVTYFEESEGIGYIYQGVRYDLTNRYDEIADPFVNGKAIVIKDGYSGLIDLESNEILPCIYKGGITYSESKRGRIFYFLLTASITCYDRDVYSEYWSLGEMIPFSTPEEMQVDFSIQSYSVVDLTNVRKAGDSIPSPIYETPGLILNKGNFFYKMDNGEILAYDYSSEPLTTVDINGYWGQPAYAPVATLPPSIADDNPKSQDIHWGQFSGEPILEVYIFHYDLPCERIDGTPPVTTKSQE